jgi:hypothetical protein
MPNWCNNSVVITHDFPEMIARAKTAFEAGRLLDEFIPVPQALQIVAGRVGADDEPEQIKLHEQTMHNLSTYGYANWHNWCVNEWGTKWDVGNDGECQDVENGLQLTFDSAWSPPIEAYKRLEEQGFHIEAMYYEPGMAFCGEYTTGLGENTITIEGDSTWVEENVPEVLDHAFAISENMAEWEEDSVDD